MFLVTETIMVMFMKKLNNCFYQTMTLLIINPCIYFHKTSIKKKKEKKKVLRTK